MPWQGGVHSPEKHREEAVGASFRKRVVEVALEQWTQPHLQSDPKIRTDMPSRLQRQFHVTGTQYISTDKVQSQTLNTGGTAEDYFSPWAISPGRFLLYLLRKLFALNIKLTIPFSAESAQRHSAPLYLPIHSSEIYLFGVHLQESCRS